MQNIKEKINVYTTEQIRQECDYKTQASGDRIANKQSN